MSNLIAASRTSRLEALRALRDRLAAAFDAQPAARDLAVPFRQMTGVLQQVDDLEHAKRELLPRRWTS